MELALHIDNGHLETEHRETDGALDLSAERLSQMTNDELLQAVRLLECRNGEWRAVGYDHRRYLQRHELEQLVRLALRLR
jgi:hypothetical protein